MANNVWDPVNGRWVDQDTGNVLVGGQGNPDGTWTGGTWQNPQGQQLIGGQWQSNPTTAPYNAQQGVYSAQQNQIGAQQGVINAQQGQIPLQQNQIGAERASNAAQGGVLAAQANTFPIQGQQIAANGQVINAQAAQTAAQQNFIGQQQQSNNAAIIDLGAIQSAKMNTGDQVNVAKAQNYFDNIGSRYSDAGVAKPTAINTQDNQFGAIAPGVFALPRTQAARVQEMADTRSQERDLQLKNAQYIVDLAGTNVDLARQEAARIGTSLDAANLVVSEAKNAAGYADLNANNAGLDVKQGQLGVDTAQIGASQAQLGTQQAQLDLSEAKNPPFAGAVPVINPTSGVADHWGTPAEADAAKLQYNANIGNQRENQGAGGASPGGTSQLVGLSQGQMLSGVASGQYAAPVVEAELVRRYNLGLSGGLPQQAAHNLVSQYDPGAVAGGSSGDSDIYGGSKPAPTPAPPAGAGAQQVWQDATDQLFNW